MKALRMLYFIRSAVYSLFLVFLAPTGEVRASTCPNLPEQVVVYFGNGINTSPESARRSRDLLRDNLGAAYKDQILRYDTAYNATDGMVNDLKQAAQQAGVQWTSDLANWLIRERLAPPWFMSWHRAQIERFTLGLLPEVDQHVESYRHTIALGQRVLVVAHSQGNFYLNDALRLLQSQLASDQLSRLAVFGVAVPSNNVAGTSRPYITNHRDFISLIPDALAANFTLRRGAGGPPADDVGSIQAHFFDETYLSDDFNVKQAVLHGLRTELDRLIESPTSSCVDEVRSFLLGMGAGDYTCFGKNDRGEEVPVGSARVGRDGRVAVQGEGIFIAAAGQQSHAPGLSLEFDVRHPNVLLDISGPSDHGMSIDAVQYSEGAQLEAGGLPISSFRARWDVRGSFEVLEVVEGDGSGINQRSVHCSPTRESANMQRVKLPTLGEVWSGAVQSLVGSRRLVFDRGACIDVKSLQPVAEPVEVDFSTKSVRIGALEVSWPDAVGDGGGLAFDRVMTGSGKFHQVDDFLPRIGFNAGDRSKLSFQVDAARGLTGLMYSDAETELACSHH